MGAQNVIEASLNNNVQKVIALSTDKHLPQLTYMEQQNYALINFL